MEAPLLKPDFLFEVGWEVCNKVGGIHTVMSTKATSLLKQMSSNYILIGPDVWRDEIENPEFMEDKMLFKAWRERSFEEGLRIRIGRWNIPGNPIAVIVDFTTFIAIKDEVLKDFWENYKLDSISGQWDYVEPVLFGYAAGKVVESFVRFNTSSRENVIAHFHEWMTGSGILYLDKYLPRVATIFTTHATVVGRSISNNYQPLYRDFENINGDGKAQELHVVSKHSLEKLAANNADCFTTVSELTSKECRQFLERNPDVITPNGFESSMVPPPQDLSDTRKLARKKLLQVASALFNYQVDENSMMLVHSGRYEMKNKGIDLFIDSLAKLNASEKFNQPVLAYILIPANHYGPKKELLNNLNKPDSATGIENPFITHNLHDLDYDPIIRKIRESGLKNSPDENVKLVFVPCYLNGKDGIFNMPYYDLLAGMDLSVFPSYYEPWGYTPLESVAFYVPTITTNLTGFGLWVNSVFPKKTQAVKVIERNEDNYEEVRDNIAKWVIDFNGKSNEEKEKIRIEACRVAKEAQWSNMVVNYYKAFDVALKVLAKRYVQPAEPEVPEQIPQIFKVFESYEPKWNNIVVQKNLPEKLKPLEAISRNLWWTWNYEAEELFALVDAKVWEKVNHNPVLLLEKVKYKRFMELEKDTAFLKSMKKVHDKFQAYISKPKPEKPVIAYFSMEYGLHYSIPIYSGGLGILAGDYLKEASDSNVHMVAVGLFYKYGYFRQQLSAAGDQISSLEASDFTHTPAMPLLDEDGNWKSISIVFPGRTLKARIWRLCVGRICLFLLDTDFEENIDQDRSITHQLYGGDWENRFKQELLLGIGGIRALKELGVNADLFHINEGHAAFIGIERLRHYIMEENLSFPEAMEVVRASTLFTTHTPVPAGHDSFDEDMLRSYIAHYPVRLNISWKQFMNLGKIHPDNPSEKFSMSYLAANLAQEINGVSKLHGEVSRHIFNDLWKGYMAEELHLGYVTNGIHYSTWTSKLWKELYNSNFGTDLAENLEKRELWQKIYEVPDNVIWEMRQTHRKLLFEYLLERFRDNFIKKYENPKYFLEVKEKLNPEALTIGFARRFATYKRAHLLFRDIERLAKIVNNPERPVQFFFAGKAHPNDKAGQDLIKYIINISKRPEFIGKILFLQNYDMFLAKKLVQGVDIWLNTPTRPLEASGTSGMKVVMNGGLHFSVLDGWWVEGFKEKAGWMLPEEQLFDNHDFQDEVDADTIYNLLEEEIVPLFYNRDEEGIPAEWVQFIKNSIAQVAPEFTMKRMLDDYQDRFYGKLFKRSMKVRENDYELARKISGWKKRVFRAWESLEVVNVSHPDVATKPVLLGQEYNGEVAIDLKELPPASLGVELVVVDFHPGNGQPNIVEVQELKLLGVENSIARYQLTLYPTKAGAYDYGIRIFPKNEDLPHRQDFGIVKWL
jgi:glycogen phosphorylase/synthase